MGDAIELHGVRKTFSTKVAVRDLDLIVPEGALYAFIGPNGAGKTTTIRMIMSILFPDRGEIAVLGRTSALDAKDRIGYLPEERGVYRKMKVSAFLAYVAKLKGAPTAGLDRRVAGWLERVGLAETRGKKCEELSKGMQQKLQFLAAVIHEPDLVILDEPFSGLDPVNMRLLRDLVLEQHRRGATVVFSTHVMIQAEQICDHVVMINDGDKVLDAPLGEVRATYDPRSLLFEPLDPGADISKVTSLPQVDTARRANSAWELELAAGVEPAAAMGEIVRALPTARIEVNRPSLEDIFVRIVSGSAGGAEVAERLRASVRGEPGMVEVLR